MSELIYPNEIITPAELDFENPITLAILADGQGIFISTDNLVTVINALDGSAGVSTDIINNELGAAFGNYRVGAITTNLSAQEIAEANTNPYQLFKTESTVQQEYGLNLNVVGHTVSFPFVGAFTGTITYTDDTTAPISGTGTYVLDGTTPVNIAKVMGTDTTLSYIWEFNQTSGDTVTDHLNGTIATLAGFPADSGYVRGGAFGDLVGYLINGTDTKATWNFPAQTHAKWKFEFEVELVGIGTTYVFGGASSWGKPDITISRAETSINLNAGFTGTANSSVGLASLEADVTRFVISLEQTDTELLWHVNGVSGWRVNTLNITFPLFQDLFHTHTNYGVGYAVTYYMMRYWNNDGAEPELLLDMDFTTGDQGKIIETINGKHAIVTVDSVVKWQPIVEDIHFSIGAGYDYTTTNLWFSANNSDNVRHHTLIMYEMESDTKTYNTTNLQKGYTYKAAAGMEPINNVAQVGFSGTLTSRAGDYATIDYKNIGIGKLSTWGALCTHVMGGCVWDVSSFVADTDALTNSSTVKVKNTLVKCATGAGADGLSGSNADNSTTLYVENSIIEGAGRFAVLYGTCTNVIFKDNNADLFNSVDAKNCVTTKSSLAGTGNILNAQAGWFNANTQITEAGQSLLTGTGWGDSNIDEWAWAPIDTGGTIQELASNITYQPTTMQPMSADLFYQLASQTINQTSEVQWVIANVNYDLNASGIDQRQKLSTVALDSHINLNSSVTEQQSQLSVSSVLMHYLTNAVSLYQPQALGTINISIGGQYQSVSIEQLQQCLATTVNELKVFNTNIAEQKTTVQSALVDEIFSVISAGIKQSSTLNNSASDKGATFNSVDVVQLCDMSVASVEMVFNTLSQHLNQQTLITSATVLAVSTYNSVSAFQAQFVGTNVIYAAVMPDIDLDTVTIISLSDRFNIKSLTPKFIIH